MKKIVDDMEVDTKMVSKFKLFCEINEQFRIAFEQTEKNSNAIRSHLDETYIFYIGHQLLHIPQYLNEIVKVFGEELPKLLSVAIFFDDKFYKFTHNKHLLNCVLLGRLLKLRPDLSGYALKYFELYAAPFEEEQQSPKKVKVDGNAICDLELVECCLSFLLFNPKFYRKWNWSKFIASYIKNPDLRVKWITAQCISIVCNMNELEQRKFILSLVPQEVHDKFTFMFNQKFTLMDFIEKPHLDLQPIVNSLVKGVIQAKCISGVYIPTKPHLLTIEQNLVEVESTRNNLRKIALALTLNKAVCVQGPVGCGKTTLIEYLAAKTGRFIGKDFIKIQLGDQMDSKMLLGTYRCTDIPGEFVWQAGVLTQAVMEGNWLLMEDIDSANMDVASVLTSLLENEALSIPGFRDNVSITPGFQLFLTRRYISTVSGHHKKHSNAMTLMKKHVIEINIDPFSSDELKQIVLTKYKPFQSIADRLIEIFKLFNVHCSHLPQYSAKTARLTSTRDFFKWLSRAIVDYNPKSQQSALNILQDAIDVFCCAYPNLEESITLAKEISTFLGIVESRAEFFCNMYKPVIQQTANKLKAGRAVMTRDTNQYTKTMNYAFTRQSAILLERIMCCVNSAEPVLLVGETGTGKTCTIQYLASTIGQKLVVINMNQQSDSADLLGGFKPVDLKFVIGPLKKEFEHVFCDYYIIEQNRKYLEKLSLCFNTERWLDVIKLMKQAYDAAIKRLSHNTNPVNDRKRSLSEEETLTKLEKKKLIKARWMSVGEKLEKINLQLKQKTSLAFSFIEGTLVKAVQKGYWVLLDEINLASAETLECLSGLLEGSHGSLCLFERGDKEPIKRHSNFTLFACMNPSTDVGKRDLPPGLRNRFTEFYVHELTEKNDLINLVINYLEILSLKDMELNKVVDLYVKVRQEAQLNLLDGIGHRPHYSLRSLCRALGIAAKNLCGTLKRNLYEAFCLSFLTQLDVDSYHTVQSLITRYILGSDSEAKAILNKQIPKPESSGLNYVQFEGYWIQQGHLDCIITEDYILTDCVRKNLKDLVRVVSIGKLPVLLQGDTSVGKTSLITYLAKASGNKCVRINNHEHTDLQEYIGSYVADLDGKLVFREGLLVEAMRQGHWIILDELNLAPTDVLEALNRVLDDNRELFIPETQVIVKAHQNFMLFATQNPPGAYGGRKMLSRAFRNRFVELHFNEIPPKELEIILHRRCQISPTHSKKMIGVMTELQMRRRGSAAFAGKQGFITLRDLFRWGERYRLASSNNKLYDWDQHLADEGYLVLAGKVRKNNEKMEIIKVMEKYLKRTVNPENLFTLSDTTSSVTRKILEDINEKKENYKNIVWTYSMRQLAVLVAKGLHFKEPVLLVGETGGGKTTVCKIIAENNGQALVTVNCHMHTESSDFIGGLRPVRNHKDNDRLFEWVNGPLIEAMRNGNVFLADEISLADDSVLERLNSLLEPDRSLLLAEKGADINNADSSELVKAHQNFHFIGTMNPGGDFGKKELSPALRNRFTEIWCEPCTSRDDLIAIVEANIKRGVSFGNQEDGSSGIGKLILDFVEWFRANDIGKKFTFSIRDILTWVNFVNVCAETVDICESYVHGANLTFLDSFGSGSTSGENPRALKMLKEICISFLNAQVENFRMDQDFVANRAGDMRLEVIGNKIGIQPFFIDFVDEVDIVGEFFFNAPTTLANLMRILRGMQLHKAILLEGSPGVGKTSLVKALAEISGHHIYRINLSDQTDISDLFGADLPVEGGTGGQFSWRDGPLLQALKRGHWILLDELNLASQSVLEGLNACLDHRGEIYIPELGKTFSVKTGTRFFAAQNPLKQGGSRRGLPQSFLNRFIQVYMDALTKEDLIFILSKQFPEFNLDVVKQMVEFNQILDAALTEHKFGHKGAPWECNLRDLTRWCEATIFHRRSGNLDDFKPEALVDLIYRDRMRTLADKDKAREIFESVFERKVIGTGPILYIDNDCVHLGDVTLPRNTSEETQRPPTGNDSSNCLVLRSQLTVLRSLSYCVNLGWMSILVGSSGCGKSGVVKTLANLAGKNLKTFPVTSAMDTTDILGGFEQTDYSRHLDELSRKMDAIADKSVRSCLLAGKTEQAVSLLELRESFLQLQGQETKTIKEEIQLFVRKLNKLNKIWDYLSELDGDHTVKNLRKKAKILKENVENDGSLNAGGKFEWVDSVLIKCLQNGDWLLVDNVNLCSAAVLDRLNALLEPRGVLTIGERGVDKKGRMVEIRPHKEFRLFLTMDPKNGEISRAMRNRGVEIYILNERESATRDQYDLKSMVQLNGLQDRKHIRALLRMHDFISDMILGEKPTINELLNAARQISQQIRYGTEETLAFSTSLIEVYYKTRSAVEFDTSDVNAAIDEKLKLELDASHRVCVNDWYNKFFNVRCERSNISSEVQRFQQQMALVHSVLKGDVAVDNENVLEYLMVMFYSISTKKDIQRRHKYVHYVLEGSEHQYLVEFLKQIYQELTEHAKFSNDDLPLDCRWLPDSKIATRSISDVNYTLLKLYLMVYYHQETKLIKMSESKVKLYDYMKSRRSKKIQDKFNDVIVNEFIDLIAAFDSYLNKILLESVSCLTNETFVSILFLIKWRFSFFKCTLVDIKTNLQPNKLLTNIKVHFNWFSKYAVRHISKLLNRDVSDELGNILKRINQAVDKEFSGLFKTGKNYQKFIDRPPPFTELAKIEAVVQFEDINELYNICNKRNKPSDVFQLLRNERNTRNLLIDIKENYDDENLNEKINVLKQTHSKNKAIVPEELDTYIFQLTPFVDYMEGLEIRRIISNGLSEYRCMKNCSVIPTDLSATLSKYCSTKDKRLHHELMKTYFLYLNNCPSSQPTLYLSQLEMDTLPVDLSGHHPKLTYYLSDLLINSESNKLSVCKLGNYRSSMNQLRFLNLNLWNNMTALQGNEYNFIVLESAYIRNDIQKFLEQLSSSLNIKSSSPKSMNEIIQECVDSINEQGKGVTSAASRNNIAKFTKIILDCYQNVDSLSRVDNDVFKEKVRLISSIHTQLGYLKLILNAQLPLIDPLTKKAIKKEYCEQAILDFGRIKMCYELQNRIYSSFPSTIHELHEPVREIIEKLTLKASSLSEYVAVRSEHLEYETMLQSVNHALSSILSMESFSALERIDLAIGNITSAMHEKADIHEATIDNLCLQYKSSIASYESLILDWSKFRVSFPDIIEPLLCNVSQFLYGYKMKISLLQKSIQQYEFYKQRVHINDAMTNLVRYPVLNGSQKDYVKQIDNYTSENTQKFISIVLKNIESPDVADKENFRLLKCGIQEAFNACVVNGNHSDILNKNIYSKFTNLVKKFVAAYNTQQTKKEEAEKEAESLYKTKTKCQDLPEEEQIENELKELFPNFHTIDFSDMQHIVQLEDDAEVTANVENTYSNEILYDDVKLVSELHLAVVQNFTKSEWLNPEKNKNVLCNFIQPLMQKFATFKQLLEKTGTALDSTVDQELFGSFSVLLGVVQLYGNDNTLDDQTASPSRSVRKDYGNFYKDADVDEVKSCFHILEELKKRIEELLDEWPEQPTLKTIVAVIERIYAFEITSPVSRFLTGLEILLSKCHEWEQVAHSGVSLSQHEQMLTQQIICWRKKELTMWKNLLNSTFDRLNDSKAKWWLYLFRITEQFIVEKLFTVEELITTLQSFIINSNIAEFQSRLDLLFAFHCYAVNYMKSPRDQQARIYHSVLWNMYQYYSQFRTSVANKIKDLRAPIEKKLKDYVKIVKWKDISYWSVKETVDKTHKILHKHVREFKEVLSQPVAKYLVDTGAEINKVQNVGIWDRPQRHTPKKYHYTIDASNYVSKKFTVKELDTKTVDTKYEILCKIDSYFSKAKKLCKDVIENTNYPNLVRDLDEFVSDIIETSNRLQNLEIDTTLPRNKQKSQAKGILQQKHRSLADLFRYLNKIGLSYRTGIVDNSLRSNTDHFIVKPVDLKASTGHIGNSRSDEKILTMWDSCEMYFVRSLIRSNNLETALLQPAKDLGLNNIERCRGFSAHLLSISHAQKTEIIEMSRYLYYLKSYFNNISRYSNCTEYKTLENIETLKKTLENALSISYQYKTILNTCPVEDSLNMNPVEILELKYVDNNFIQYKCDTNWTNLYESFNHIISLSNKTLHAIKKCMTFVPCTDYQLSQPSIIPVEENDVILCNVDLIISKIDEVLSKTENRYLFNSLKWLQSEILEVKYKLGKSFSNDGMNINNLHTEVENSSSKLLFVIQELYKKYSNKTNATNDETTEEENQSELQEGHLKTLLVESLSVDMEVMNVKMIMKSVAKVVACVYNIEMPLDENSKSTLAHYLSLLDQTILLYQYFFTQQVSAYRVTCKLNTILLSIFTELASKGFCVPPEFSEELGEEGMGKPSNGMGLGDGQGEKDVSDKIESEDQLDEAKLDGQEKDKEEDADCKEEEKGIEMSEDFDSKLQDKEKKNEDEDESDNNSDSDAEEQMGETGKGANNLDEEIWGSDKEDDDEASGEEEGNQQEDEECGNKGEDESDKQVGAKEKDAKNKPTEEDEEAGDQIQKDKKEINELKEPEYDEDQVDPYHGDLPEPPEPEPMDLPDDLKLDDGEDNDTDQQEENPFDIDALKEQNISENKDETAEEEPKDVKENDEIEEFSSDEEDTNKGDRDESEEQEEGNDEREPEELAEDINKENNSTEGEQAEEEKNCDEDDANEMEKSGLDQKTTSDERVEAMDVDDSEAADKTEGADSRSKSSQPIDELQQEDNPDNDGMGQSQMEENKSGHSTQTDKPQEMEAASEDNEENLKRKQKPGESDSQRSLGDVEEPVQKKLKTIDSKNNEENDDKQPEEDNQATAEMYKHIKDAKENATQVLDVATKEQAERQKEQTVPNKEDEQTEEATESSNNLPEEEIKNDEMNEIAKQKAEKTENQKDKKNERKSHPEGEILEEMDCVEVEGDIVETSTVARGPESSHHTLFQDMKEIINSTLSIDEMNALRSEVEHQMSTWYEPPSDVEAEQTWQKISSVTAAMAQELSEQLRLVLEPTQASRLKGDYRTGRRINMRKVIPYIASQFRKDKIWLRRTKPSKREYQIVLAIDDSASMAENKSKEMTFESVALISKALTLLESGQLSIVSFGEKTEVLHKLNDQFTDKIGVKLLQKFKFDQNKTRYADMVDFTTEMLSQSQMQSSSLTAKLLIIISDGHGVFSQGQALMRQAVRRGKLANIFTIFVIIDNPENRHSVLSIRMPDFQGNKLIKIDNYMDKFPFSFYIILRDLVSLPNVLSDALRQWFELVSNSDKQ